MPICGIYCRVQCKGETEDAVDVRLAVNRCVVREDRRLHVRRVFPVGHFCLECASLFLQSVIGHVFDVLALDTSSPNHFHCISSCKHSQRSSLNELARSSTEVSTGNGADRPVTQTADRTAGPSSVPPVSRCGENRLPLSRRFGEGERAGGERADDE